MFYAIAVSFVAGVVGTAIGGVFLGFIKSPGDSLSGIMMGFSGGIMISIVLFDMFPEAVEASGVLITAISAIVGVIILHVLHELLPDHDHGAPGHDVHKHDGSKLVQGKMNKTGLLMLVGIALHNLPEGLAVGSGLSVGEISIAQNYGMSLALLLLLHNIPEGIALAIPFRLAGNSVFKVVRMAAVAGVPTVIGAMIGYALGSISEVFITASIAFGGGAMLYISVRELFPDSLQLANKKFATLAIGAGLAVGFLMVHFVHGI